MKYKIDDLVWAKMSRFPYWPARVIQPDPNVKAPKLKEDYQFVIFFGTNDVAWIENENIIPHSEDLFQTKMAKRTSNAWKFAVEDLKSYLALPLGVPEQPSPIVKKKVENKTKRRREPVVEQDQGSPKRKSMRVVKIVETRPKRRGRNVLSQKSGFKKVSKKVPINVNRESSANSPSTSDKLHTSRDISLGRRRSLKRGESSKIAAMGRKHSMEQDLYLDDFPVSNKDITEIDGSNQTGSSDMMVISEQPVKNYGFMGLNFPGKQIVKKFIEYGLEITLWDNVGKYEEFTTMDKKVKIAQSPAELIRKCDITFCCYESYSDAFENIIYGPNGVIEGFEEAEKLGHRPGYVSLTSVDCETSKVIQKTINTRNGMYLDAQVHGSRHEIETGNLIINSAGDANLFSDCEKCFKIISKHYLFTGHDIDINATTNSLYSLVSRNVLFVIAEVMNLVGKLNLFEKSIIETIIPVMLEMSAISEKVNLMGAFRCDLITQLKYVQKDISNVLVLADEVSQRMPLSAAVNEVYKHAKILGFSDRDVSAVYNTLKE